MIVEQTAEEAKLVSINNRHKVLESFVKILNGRINANAANGHFTASISLDIDGDHTTEEIESVRKLFHDSNYESSISNYYLTISWKNAKLTPAKFDDIVDSTAFKGK